MKTLAEILFQQRMEKAEVCDRRARMHGVDTPHGHAYRAEEDHWHTAALLADRGDCTPRVVTFHVDPDGKGNEIARVIVAGVIVETDRFASYTAALEWARLTAKEWREGKAELA